jgi:hypothetical protein
MAAPPSHHATPPQELHLAPQPRGTPPQSDGRSDFADLFGHILPIFRMIFNKQWARKGLLKEFPRKCSLNGTSTPRNPEEAPRTRSEVPRQTPGAALAF